MKKKKEDIKIDSNKKNKVIFDEETDSSINGFSIVLTFFIIGLFLQINNNFFGMATNLVTVLFIIGGFIGLCSEIGNLNEKLQIKGIDNIAIGIVV